MKKETILRVIILVVGLAIAHLGVTLFLLANLGADPFNVLIFTTCFYSPSLQRTEHLQQKWYAIYWAV